jgi:hypothetical protein
VLRLILSPRWILLHLLALAAVTACLWLAAWQWQRAGSAMGSALNVGYGLQWPLFAVFFAVMWWRFLRMDIAQLDAADDDNENEDSDSGGSGSHGRGNGRRSPQPPPVRAPVHGPNPFGPRPESARPAAIDEDSALGAYNRMLAQLAARDPENR